MTASEINAALLGFTDVRRLEFETDPVSGECDLELRLECASDTRRAIEVLLSGVADLSIGDYGGGRTQLLLLRVEDISDEQRDRVNYRVRELEHDRFACVCRAVGVTQTAKT